MTHGIRVWIRSRTREWHTSAQTHVRTQITHNFPPHTYFTYATIESIAISNHQSACEQRKRYVRGPIVAYAYTHSLVTDIIVFSRLSATLEFVLYFVIESAVSLCVLFCVVHSFRCCGLVLVSQIIRFDHHVLLIWILCFAKNKQFSICTSVHRSTHMLLCRVLCVCANSKRGQVILKFKLARKKFCLKSRIYICFQKSLLSHFKLFIRASLYVFVSLVGHSSFG